MQYGKEGIEQNGGDDGNMPEDIFDMFFGGGGRRGRGRGGGGGKPRGKDVVHPIKVSLEDLCLGKTLKLAINRNVLCSKCNATGSKSGRDTSCSSCNGRGMRVEVRRMGPMVTQMQSPCSDCNGTGARELLGPALHPRAALTPLPPPAPGRAIDPSDTCDACRGKKVSSERKVIEVFIEKGMRHHQKIVFREHADEAPGVTPGDLIFVLEQKEHDVYKRKVRRGCLIHRAVPASFH